MDDGQLRIEVVPTQPGEYRVRLMGEFDVNHADRVKDHLLGMGRSRLVVDLSGIDFLDSSGIAAFVMVKKRLDEAGHELVLTNPSSMIRQLFRTVGLEDWLTQ
jgi:anti-sigma B factor antagonist